jgi:hypothetical protein
MYLVIEFLLQQQLPLSGPLGQPADRVHLERGWRGAADEPGAGAALLRRAALQDVERQGLARRGRRLRLQALRAGPPAALRQPPARPQPVRQDHAP